MKAHWKIRRVAAVGVLLGLVAGALPVSAARAAGACKMRCAAPGRCCCAHGGTGDACRMSRPCRPQDTAEPRAAETLPCLPALPAQTADVDRTRADAPPLPTSPVPATDAPDPPDPPPRAA